MHCSVTVPLMVPVMLPPPHARTLRGYHCKSEEALASANMGLALARQLQRYDYVLQTATVLLRAWHGRNSIHAGRLLCALFRLDPLAPRCANSAAPDMTDTARACPLCSSICVVLPSVLPAYCSGSTAYLSIPSDVNRQPQLPTLLARR